MVSRLKLKVEKGKKKICIVNGVHLEEDAKSRGTRHVHE